MVNQMVAEVDMQLLMVVAVDMEVLVMVAGEEGMVVEAAVAVVEVEVIHKKHCQWAQIKLVNQLDMMQSKKIFIFKKKL